MIKRDCPPHIGTGVTPKDGTCHNHRSDVQQGFHNAHCQGIGCEHAKTGFERHEDMPVIEPRNRLERFLLRLDGMLDVARRRYEAVFGDSKKIEDKDPKDR